MLVADEDAAVVDAEDLGRLPGEPVQHDPAVAAVRHLAAQVADRGGRAHVRRCHGPTVPSPLRRSSVLDGRASGAPAADV